MIALHGVSKTVPSGEAMLTMHPEEAKRRIVREAVRLLKPGGKYGIHELSLLPDNITPGERDEIHGALTQSIHVGARPLTVSEWRELLQTEGLEVRFEARAPMHLLELRRVLRDEGFLGTVRIAVNALRFREARRRVLGMRRVFRKYDRHLGAVTLVAIKPAWVQRPPRC